MSRPTLLALAAVLVLLVAIGAIAYFEPELPAWLSKRKSTPRVDPQADQTLPPVPRVSRLPAPTEENRKAPPGTFYLLKRVKATSSSGVKAAVPGELVHLLERRPDGKLRVTVGAADFVVPPDHVTDDLETAREAETKYLQRPPDGL